MIIPNVDSVAQFRVETSNFGAASGRHPLQVKLITKGGTNVLHGTAFEFLRNDVLDARNTFASDRPKLRTEPVWGSLGGPIRKDKTFFFTSFEDTLIRTETLFNSFALTRICRRETSGLQNHGSGDQPALPGYQIPQARISSASRFFLPYLLKPNAAGDRFVAQAPIPSDSTNLFLRFDHQISTTQRGLWRWTRNEHESDSLGYTPDIVTTQTIAQHSWHQLRLDHHSANRAQPGLGVLAFDYARNLSVVGKENLNQKAGLARLSHGADGRHDWIADGGQSHPSAALIPGTSAFFLQARVFGAIASLNLIRKEPYHHSRSRVRRPPHGDSPRSTAPRGSFTFNGQYTAMGWPIICWGWFKRVQEFSTRRFRSGAFAVRGFLRAGRFQSPAHIDVQRGTAVRPLE